MDPVTFYAILTGLTAATTTAVLYAQYASGVRQRRRREEQERNKPPPPPKNEGSSPEKDKADDLGKEEDGTGNAQKSRLEKAIDTLTGNVKLASKKRFVGYRVVSEEAIGVRVVESSTPVDGYDIRTIQDVSEVPMLLPEELAMDEDEFWRRIIMGESLVLVPVEKQPIMRPIHEEVYEDVVQVLYILLDYSGSMGKDFAPWRIPVWKGVVRRLIAKALESGAIVMLRTYNNRPRQLYKAEADPNQYIELMDIVARFRPGGGTDNGLALRCSMDDMSEMEFDEAYITIVSDGEDDKFDGNAIRAELDEKGIKLHAIMLGAENSELLKATDIYQIVEQNMVVHPPVYRRRD